jgi:hypothetical protein
MGVRRGDNRETCGTETNARLSLDERIILKWF